MTRKWAVIKVSCPPTGVGSLEERKCSREQVEHLVLFPGSYGFASTAFTAGFIDLHFPVMSSPFCALCVFQAGDKHYHPSCARCSRCNQMFTEGEEMYLQGEQTLALLLRTETAQLQYE